MFPWVYESNYFIRVCVFVCLCVFVTAMRFEILGPIATKICTRTKYLPGKVLQLISISKTDGKTAFESHTGISCCYGNGLDIWNRTKLGTATFFHAASRAVRRLKALH